MSYSRILLRIVLVAIATIQLAACSKTVQWEEEVPLNTGETIWVKRTVHYTLKGGAGNPLDVAYRPDRQEQLEFKWSGTHYHFEGDARIILLAISPRKQPVLVAQANAGGWHWKHNYKCTVPFYVQFVPDTGGRNWSWPPSIEPWLYELPHNLMRSRNGPGEMSRRYTSQQRSQEDSTGSIQDPSSARIDPNHKVNTCF